MSSSISLQHLIKAGLSGFAALDVDGHGKRIPDHVAPFRLCTKLFNLNSMALRARSFARRSCSTAGPGNQRSEITELGASHSVTVHPCQVRHRKNPFGLGRMADV
jgi:hypothetical protein